MERQEFPYKQCGECPYRGYEESVRLFGPRTGGINFDSKEMACGQKICKLEETLISGAKAPSSDNLLNKIVIVMEKRKMKIRKATKKDISKLIEIVKGVKSIEDFPGEYSKDLFNKAITRKENIFLVAEIDNEVTGFVICYFNKEWKRIYIDSLAVKKEYRNQGIATNLVRFIEKFSRDKNVKTIYFNTRVWNIPMVKLAKRNQYKLKEKFYIWEKKLK